MEGNIRLSSIITRGALGLQYTTRRILSTGTPDQTTEHCIRTDTTTVSITLARSISRIATQAVIISRRATTKGSLLDFKDSRPLTRHSTILGSQPPSKNEVSSIFMTSIDSEKSSSKKTKRTVIKGLTNQCLYLPCKKPSSPAPQGQKIWSRSILFC